MTIELQECLHGDNSWPDDELKTLRNELLDEQETLKTAEVEIQERETQIKELTALKEGYDAIITSYRQKYQELKDKQEGYEKFCKEEKECLERVLRSANRICPTVDEIKKGIDDRNLDIAKNEAYLEAAKKERARADTALAEAKAKFEEWKKLVNSIEARLKSLDQQRKDICKEHETRNFAVAYYLLACNGKYCDQVKGQPEVVKPEEVLEKLKSAWEKFKEADKARNAKDAEIKSLEKQLETKKKQLDDDKKNLEMTIRRKLSELNDTNTECK